MACYDCYECANHIDNGGVCEDYYYDCPFNIIKKLSEEKLYMIRNAISNIDTSINWLEELDEDDDMHNEIWEMLNQLSTLKEYVSEETELKWNQINGKGNLVSKEDELTISPKVESIVSPEISSMISQIIQLEKHHQTNQQKRNGRINLVSAKKIVKLSEDAERFLRKCRDEIPGFSSDEFDHLQADYMIIKYKKELGKSPEYEEFLEKNPFNSRIKDKDGTLRKIERDILDMALRGGCFVQYYSDVIKQPAYGLETFDDNDVICINKHIDYIESLGYDVRFNYKRDFDEYDTDSVMVIIEWRDDY